MAGEVCAQRYDAFVPFAWMQARSAHAVQTYGDVDELAVTVAAYLSEGFESGAPAVVIATAANWSPFAAHLVSAGYDPSTLEARGLLTLLDADETLAKVMTSDGPSAPAFERMVGGVIDRLATQFPGKEVRAFGEMVDVLAQRGALDAAIALEELWNDLASTRRFSLLCGYHLDVFDLATQTTPLPRICRVHSHVVPAVDSARFAQAVERALDEVLGPTQAGKVYMVVGHEARRGRVPVAQLALQWISINIPALAERVLSRARLYYSEPPAVPVG
jgi:hypothetical protein